MSLHTLATDVPHSRDYASEWALVDVETTGFVARQHRILSVAVITLGPDGEQTGEFSTLVDPGCDPGPVEVHGLTREKLAGAPTFDQVAGRIGAMLQDRALVAHNAEFDYDFLAHEFARARMWLPVSRRLCTLALNRRIDPPTDDLRLATLAAHYGVPQLRAHDALDDTRVLAGIFPATLNEAARLDLPLPLVSCPPRQNSQFTPQPPKTPCAYRNPGRMTVGGQLSQGMKVALTGETTLSRAELVARSVAAGLNMMSSVSRHTSVLVTNDAASRSTKARRAVTEGVPVIDEQTFLGRLTDVRPGTPHESPATVPDATPTPAETVAPEAVSLPEPREPAEDVGRTPVPIPAPAFARTKAADRPLSGRRVLVLGGTHTQAAAARVRVVELGASAAVNLSARVSDVVLLPGGDTDRRMKRITSLELPVYDTEWLDEPTVAPLRLDAYRRSPLTLPRGGVTDLPVRSSMSGWSVSAAWAQQTAHDIDLVAFLLDEEGQVSCDEHFVFYGAPESPDGTVRLHTDGPTEQTVTTDLVNLPPAVRRIVVAAAIDGTATFGDVGAVQLTTGPGDSAAPLAQAALDAATTERTLILAEIYRRGSLWRFRAIGQGYDHGLDALARDCGVDVGG